MTVVAIDGPAGSGKSTVAAALAERLGVVHVDTGAYYRAATLIALRTGAALDDEAAVVQAISRATITRDGGRTRVDGRDVEEQIRGPAVTAAVSSVSQHPRVREHLVGLQRAAVDAAGAVVEGRDAATVVVPDADLKVWLTASSHERAVRRAAQRGESGSGAVAAHAADIARRDELDAAQMTRHSAAIVVDTTDRPIADIVADIAARIERGAGRP